MAISCVNLLDAQGIRRTLSAGRCALCFLWRGYQLGNNYKTNAPLVDILAKLYVRKKGWRNVHLKDVGEIVSILPIIPVYIDSLILCKTISLASCTSCPEHGPANRIGKFEIS